MSAGDSGAEVNLLCQRWVSRQQRPARDKTREECVTPLWFFKMAATVFLLFLCLPSRERELKPSCCYAEKKDHTLFQAKWRFGLGNGQSATWLLFQIERRCGAIPSVHMRALDGSTKTNPDLLEGRAQLSLKLGFFFCLEQTHVKTAFKCKDPRQAWFHAEKLPTFMRTWQRTAVLLFDTGTNIGQTYSCWGPRWAKWTRWSD